MLSSTSQQVEAGRGHRLELWLVILLWLTLSAAVTFRFCNIDNKLCWGDECFTRMRVAGFGRAELSHFWSSCARPISSDEAQSFMRLRWKHQAHLAQRPLLHEDFQTCPLYYWTARIWAEFLGDSASSLRYFSVLTSLLAFPLLYLCSLELFRCRRTACITLCLFASSPIILIYAQQIRHYSMWVLTVLLASLALLRAVRLNRRRTWVGYSAAVLISFLTNPLSVLVVIGHGAFILLREKPQGRLKAFVLSVLAGSLAFVPRIFTSSFNIVTGVGFGWLAQAPQGGLWHYLVGTFVRNFTRLFWDSAYWTASVANVLAAVSSVALAVWSLLYINRQGSREQKLFVNCLIAASLIPLILRDLVMLGCSATVTRYIFPSLLGIELAVGYSFAQLTAAVSASCAPVLPSWRRASTAALLIAVVAIGLYSSLTGSLAATPWPSQTPTSAPVAEIAAEINCRHRPVVLVFWAGISYMPLILADRLKSGVEIIPVSSRTNQWQSLLLNELKSGREVLAWDPWHRSHDELRPPYGISLRSIDSERQLLKVMLEPSADYLPTAGRLRAEQGRPD